MLYSVSMVRRIGVFALLVFFVFSASPQEDGDSIFPPHAILNASFFGDEAMVVQILEAGADRDVKTSLGDTALHLAVYQNNPNVVRILLEYGFDPDARNNFGDTPLHNAVTANNENAVRLLLHYRANRDIRNLEGISPLEMARIEGKTQIVRLFFR